MTNLLDVSGLRLDYGRTMAVKGIDLAVPQGSVVCLIGANGAGKTTTMRGLSGLLKAAGGSVRFEGTDITNAPAHRIARLGIRQVPEGRQVFAEMTVDENLRLGGLQAPDAGEFQKRRGRVLERFPRLQERLAQQAGLLSGGEQQMLALGRALMGAPRLLLLDEPSMGLAPLFVEEIFRIIADLKREGTTILLVEQNAQAALEIADYAYVLESGRITLHGPGARIADDPKVVAAYLGGH
ncbi:ABC transporter ATP-binding protein [Azospirillum agricola]|uniref:ABC transporter ATP-binding protein n=1 Tax=Azospirillum agricola TaxID=1720247 RepID=UPI000A0EF5CF|nr:ABC transporter ATP-binding protein [Azospirillum agricola]SMH31759.1 amino acid/amide ABC transporter ATP-binding protein 2, HAAT family [Azospirillum lipoferum]